MSNKSASFQKFAIFEHLQTGDIVEDSKIMEIYRNGFKEEAFRHIVKKYGERLYWHIRRFVYDHDETDDILQDVYLKIWKGLPDFRGESELYTWFYRIATNQAINAVKKLRLRCFITLDSIEHIFAKRIESNIQTGGDQIQTILHKAISTLPEKQKLVFCLRYFDELSYEAIAEITDTTVGALKASYHHAYNKIKLYIQTNV